MNNPQAPLRWRLAATIGPEVVALGITVVLAIIIVLGVARGGAADGGTVGSPTPSTSPATGLVVRSPTPWS